ncbi:MAG: hypothetical protein M3237_22170 [Actinomycetota bacterium]|nr:hypothetical protein [Actinomycetota bacterium]
MVISLMLSTTAGPAVAKPPAKPSAPTDLALSASKSGSTFNVKVSWRAGTNATKYVVRLSRAGVTLDSATVSALTWTGHTTVPDGSTVRASVTSYNGRRRGGTATRSFVLPDLTAPVASYTVTQNGPEVRVAVSSVDDNITRDADIVVGIDWGHGTPEQWDHSQPMSHLYPDVEARYEARITVEDEAHNQRIYPLGIVVNDGIKPTGEFALVNSSAWAGWTKVSLKQIRIDDNLSPDDKITRVIRWGDGATTIWEQGTTPNHVYHGPGFFSPTLTLIDEAGNLSSALPTSTVKVMVDSARPTIRLTPPRKRKSSVASWRTLKGRAVDAQTGVRTVQLTAIEKRGTRWYAYKANTRSWVKARSKSAAWKRAVAASVRPTTAGNWSVRVSGLRKGRLIYQARAFDNRANASVRVSKRAALTKR